MTDDVRILSSASPDEGLGDASSWRFFAASVGLFAVVVMAVGLVLG